MHLTPAILESAYEYLRATPPFSKWSLPEADAVEFRVTGSKTDFGECETDDCAANAPIISISGRLCSKNDIFLRTLAHECVHLHQFASDHKGKASAEHGEKFKKLAKQVCRSMGWDVETF